jgi:hypothetical protein
MPRRNPDTAASRRTEIVGMLRAMPTKWRRAYNTARRTLSDNGGPVLPDVPTPEQAMLILGNTAGGNRDIDQPTGDQRVPQGVRDEAMHGLRLSYKNDYAGWEFFGIARAIQLVLAPGVPMRTRERMKRYLEAHQKDKLAPHYGDEEKPSKGYMAMLNWGGDEGRAWNDDVKRATYSARTRGERDNPARTMPSDEPPTRPTEALTAAAVTPPSAIAAKKRSKKPTDVIAVLSEPRSVFHNYVVLFDSAVFARGELSEADVLGYATASLQRNTASIAVAAAEPGYAYLMYATLAKSIASESPGAMLVGSYSQTEYAKRFWARQPNGAIGNMPPSLFRRTFGVSYASFTSAGEELVQRLAKALGMDERTARLRLKLLGSTYFDDYYSVSNTASSRLGPEKLPRPASPRQTVEEVKKLTTRKLSSSNLAMVVTTVPYFGYTQAYLVAVPKGKSTITPANLVAEFKPERPSYPGERTFAEVYGPLAERRLSSEAAKAMQVLREYNTTVETARTRREVAKWAARGETLKAALAAAGMTDLDGFFVYLSRGAHIYGERASRVASEQPTKLNPRRKKFEVTIVMPV